MSMLGGLFGGGHKKHPNLDRIAKSLHGHLGLNVAAPPPEVVDIIEQISDRDLFHFDNMQSVPGLQALFKARSIQASVDAATSTVMLALVSSTAPSAGSSAGPASRPVLHIGIHRAEYHVAKTKELPGAIPAAARQSEEPMTTASGGFEHLEAFEDLAPKLVDLLVRHGQLTSADKEVLRKIRPLDSSLESRVAALERWKMETTRRVRGMSLPKTAQRMTLGAGEDTLMAGSEEALMRRFDNLVLWTSKLIKAIEHEGIRFHNKPMWLRK